MVWNFSRPTANRIVIKGLNENKDSIHVVLDRVIKKYPIKYDRSQARL